MIPQRASDYTVPKSPEQWLSPFLEVSTEHAGSVRAVQLLRNLQHVSREHLKNNLTEAFAAISDTMQQIQLEPSTATPTVLQDIGAARNPKQSLQDTPSTIDHVPLLLYNLGRVLQAHKSIDKDMQQQNRTILKRLFEVLFGPNTCSFDPSSLFVEKIVHVVIGILALPGKLDVLTTDYHDGC